MSKKKLSYDDFKKYFGNNLQDKDKHAFEKSMMQDAFEEEAFDGLSGLSEEELDKDIAELKSGIESKTKQTHRVVPGWFKYAAGIVILMGIGSILFFLNSRLWQDTMLKDQVAREVKATDSIFYEAEGEIPVTEQDTFSRDKSTAMIAENKKTKTESSADFEIVEDQMKIEDEMLFESQAEELDEELVVMEFEEEMVDEQLALMDTQAKKEDIALDTDKNLAKATEEVEFSEDLQGNVAGVRISESSSAQKAVRKSEATVIKGKVVSSDDELSIPGVSLIVKDNPTIGTITDVNGEFQLTLPQSDEELKTLIASFIGMESQEITIENDTNILVYLEPDALEMDEVVVTGYATNTDKGADVVRTNAQPPGDLSFRKYKKQILEKLDYSKFSEYPGKHKIKFSFTVKPDGSLHNFNFKNVPAKEFSKEIIRVMKELGHWKPASEDDFDISSEVKMSLKLDIEE